MQKRTDIHEYDIPQNDIECWDRYPKHRWVYELSRLLDAQNIKWSPIDLKGMTCETNMILETKNSISIYSGQIYVSKPDEHHVLSEVYISKGEIKLMRQYDADTAKELESLIGEVELRINAFITLYFQKFTGIITVETWGNEIFRIRLRPHGDLTRESNQEVIKLVKRIYKRTDSVIGLTDRVFHGTLAS